MDENAQTYADTGFPPIDHDHREISALLSQVQQDAAADRPSEARTSLAALLALASAHFAHEEQLMRDSRYPRRVQHREAHAQFEQDALTLQKELESDGLTPAFRRWASDGAGQWFHHHVMAHDLELGLFLLEERKLRRRARA